MILDEADLQTLSSESSSSGAFSPEDFLARARGRLRAEPPGPDEPQSNPKGDHQFDVSVQRPLDAALFKPAAVLVPVVMHADGPTVLLTERATSLRYHSGQIACPGGRIDPGDESAIAAALREADEEIGLKAEYVRPLGYLDAYLSGTGYFVIPVVGLVRPGCPLHPNPAEVASVFEVPLRFLMDPHNHELHAREWRGRIRQYYAMPFGERYIWGVTAGILRNLYERLYG